MSAPAAIKGTFVKIEPVMTRKCVRFGIEVPIEEADAALRALGGFPDGANPKWVAIALLNPEVVQAPPAKPEKERRSFDELPASQQAALLCKEPRFQRFIAELTTFPETEEGAADAVRYLCHVDSRAALNTLEGEHFWGNVHSEYRTWLSL